MKIRVEYLNTDTGETLDCQALDWDDWRTVNAFWFNPTMEAYLLNNRSYAMNAGACGNIRLTLIDDERNPTMTPTTDAQALIARVHRATGLRADAIWQRCNAALPQNLSEDRQLMLTDTASALAGYLHIDASETLLATITAVEAAYLVPFARAYGVPIWNAGWPEASGGYQFRYDSIMAAWTISNGVECINLGNGSYLQAVQEADRSDWTFERPEQKRIVCSVIYEGMGWTLMHREGEGYSLTRPLNEYRTILASSDQRAKNVVTEGGGMIVEEMLLADYIAREA